MQENITNGPKAITLEVLQEFLPPGSLSTASPVAAAAAGTTSSPVARDWLPLWKPSDFAAFRPAADFVLAGDCHFTRGGITVLGGWPGVGKSRAALGLAVAGATGQSWLGHSIHARFRTLIIQAENGEWRLKQELAEALPPGDMDEWIRITPPPPFGLAFLEAGFREQVTEAVLSFRPGLIIIDPWNRVAEGDRQGDYRHALEAIMECLPAAAHERPAILILHHMRKKSSDSTRKLGRELLHELAGSYQIGSAARCVFILEPASNSTEDPTVVLTCCKNNDGREGSPSAWIRRNGLFAPAQEFDLDAFLNPETAPKGKQTSSPAIAAALEGMQGETKSQAVARLVDAGVCERSTAYTILARHEQVEEDEEHRLWWRAEP